MKQEYSDAEMIRRVTAIEDVKNLMGRRAMYQANECRREELEELWVSEEEHRRTASFGGNWGYYVGMEDIFAWYVTAHEEKRRRQLSYAKKLHPELTETDLGFGCMQAHPVSTPLVRLAGDGKTARGLWYSIGQETFLKEDGSPCALWVNDKIGADLILEDGKWKIWHLVIANDVYHESGEDFTKMPVYLEPEEDWAQVEFGNPTITMTVHEPYFLWSDQYPGIPQPYESFDIKDSYAPEGHPAYPKGFRAYKDGVFR